MKSRFWGLAMCGAGLALSSGAGLARAGVITEIVAVDQLVNGNVTYGYNAASLGAGYHTTGGCPTESGGVVCTNSYVGTMDTSGLLTSVLQSVTMTGSTPPVANIGQPAYNANAAALALANVTAGVVGVSAGGDYLDIRFPESGQGGGSSTSFAQINDTLDFSVAGASASQVTDITVSFAVDGQMTAATPAGDSHGSLRSILSFGGATEETDVNLTGNTGYGPMLAPTTSSGWVSEQVTGNAGAFIFTGVYAITGSQADLPIAETLSDGCGLGTSCDYSHTGAVTFTLPNNVSFSSADSFGTQPPLSAPEPGSLTLVASAAALAPWVARKRARRA